jgi:hypothetical protein
MSTVLPNWHRPAPDTAAKVNRRYGGKTMKATYMRAALFLAAACLVVVPWILAFVAVTGSPHPGSKEDGPYTGATYLSVLTFPAAFALIAIAVLAIKPKRS